MQKLRIAFVVDKFPCLSETFVLYQITGLLDRGHEVEIFANNHPRESVVHPHVERYKLDQRAYYSPENCAVRYLKAIGWTVVLFLQRPLSTFRLWSLIFRQKPFSLNPLFFLVHYLRKRFDIVQCHFGPNGNMAAGLKRTGLEAKVLTMFHGYDMRIGQRRPSDFYGPLFSYGDCLLANSKYSHAYLLRAGAPPEKTVILYAGFDFRQFADRTRPIHSVRPEKIVAITVARLVEEKGLQYGLEAIKEVHSRHPHWPLEYNIIGDGHLRERLEQFAEDYRIAGIVNFLGPMKHQDIIDHLYQSHIFFLPSIAEALPVALMEGQAAELPVVATEVGSVSEIVLDGQSGYIVPPKNASAMAQKLQHLIEHFELWPAMGEKGRIHVRNNFDINRLNDQLIEIYQALLNSSQSNISSHNQPEVLTQ